MDQKLIEAFWNNVYRLNDSDCWVWLGYREVTGYGVLTYDYKRYKAHRLSWTIANGKDIPDSLLIMHTCDNRSCVNPTHLQLGTQDDNMKDCKAKGRIARQIGEKHGRSVLTESQVLEIISELNTGIAVHILAKRYKVNWETIKAIKIGRSWKHLSR